METDTDVLNVLSGVLSQLVQRNDNALIVRRQQQLQQLQNQQQDPMHQPQTQDEASNISSTDNNNNNNNNNSSNGNSNRNGRSSTSSSNNGTLASSDNSNNNNNGNNVRGGIDALVDPNGVTVFHAQRPPSISVHAYLERILRYSGCGRECFVVALVYIDRLIQRHSDLMVSTLNVHRLLITSIMLAAKFCEDTYYNNAYFARIGGISVQEMNLLEIEMLFLINFSLNVTPDMYGKYWTELSKHHVGGNGGGNISVPIPNQQQQQQQHHQQQQQQQMQTQMQQGNDGMTN